MLAVTCVLALFAFQSSRPTSRPAPKRSGPAPVVLEELKAPPLSRSGAERPPEDGFIARNAGVADRFTEEGTDVSYAFESRGGEVSLFQLSSSGFERGWHSTARVRILDEAGLELASRLRAGPSAYELFLAFEAPYSGTFQCELSAAKEYYRYTLIRHSDFPANYGERINLGASSHAYAFLADSRSRVTFQLKLEAGQETSFRALNFEPSARDAVARTRNPALRDEAAGAMTLDSAPATDLDWPTLALRVIGEPDSRTAPSHYATFTPKAAGTYFIEVFCVGQSEGGLFEFQAHRNLKRERVTGIVADRYGRAREGVRLKFYSEPDFALIGSAITNAEGRYEAQVSRGPYMITMQGEGRTMVTLRTNVLRTRELNTIYSAGRERTATSRPTRR